LEFITLHPRFFEHISLHGLHMFIEATTYYWYTTLDMLRSLKAKSRTQY